MALIKVIIRATGDEANELEASGNSVEEVLKAAGRSAKGMNILVNEKMAQLDTHVTEGDVIELAPRPKGS